MRDPQNRLRLAFRVEGGNWVAYAADLQSMDGAVELARIRMAIVEDDTIKAGFMDLMRDSLAGILLRSGVDVTAWNEPAPAPEHERSGQA